MSSNTLRQRAWRVTVGTLQLQANDLEFSCKRTLRPEPNNCDLKLYNLAPAHRKAIEQNPALTTQQKVPVRLEAGYGTNLVQLYQGELRAGWTVNEGPEVITEISTGDGEKEFCTARMNVSFGPSTSNEIVMREILATMGISQGNIQNAISLMGAKGQVTFSAKAQVLKGNCAEHMTDLCNSVGLEWSIQNGAAQFLPLGQPLAGQVYQMNADSGLVGSPSVDSKGVLTFTTFIVPGMVPGAIVQMDALNVKGGYRIVTVEYSGDTLGNDWYAKCQAEKY